MHPPLAAAGLLLFVLALLHLLHSGSGFVPSLSSLMTCGKRGSITRAPRALGSTTRALRALPQPHSQEDAKPPKEDLGSLVKKYGSRYLLTWFAVYLPFLASFYVLAGSDLLPFKMEDALSFIDRFCSWLQSLGLTSVSSEAARNNPNVVRFATSYLAADLVPTTVFALALLSAYTKAVGTRTE